jgi:hypothetical protein
MVFIAVSKVKKATVTSSKLSDLQRGITTAAVVSPPTIEAKMKDCRISHPMRRFTKSPMIVVLART